MEHGGSCHTIGQGNPVADRSGQLGFRRVSSSLNIDPLVLIDPKEDVVKIDSQKSTGIAVTNTVSCLAVVFLHCCAAFWVFQPTKRYDVNLMVQVLARFGVPCFLMITGATLFEFLAKYDVATYTRKRITRIVIPFLLWSEIFILWHLATGASHYKSVLRTFVAPLLTNGANGVYWYFYAVFSMYLFIPLLSAALIHMSQQQRVRWVAFIGIVFYVMNRLIPFIRQRGIPLTDALTPAFGLGYFDFCCLGYILVAIDIPKLWRRVLYVAGCVMAVAMFCWTHHENYAAGSNVDTFFQYDSLPGAVMAASVFVFFLYFPYKILGEKFTSAIRAMSGLSYGVYLSHILILFYVDLAVVRFGADPASAKLLALRAFVTYGIAVALVWVLKRIPKIGDLLVP